MTERATEIGDPLEGEVPEDEPDLPAVDEDTLEEKVELLTTDPPDPADYAKGGVLVPGSTPVLNDTGKPVEVVSADYDPTTQQEPL